MMSLPLHVQKKPVLGWYWGRVVGQMEEPAQKTKGRGGLFVTRGKAKLINWSKENTSEVGGFEDIEEGRGQIM